LFGLGSIFFPEFFNRPAVSTILCLPVKKGWHWEHISTLISFLVDLVLKVLPQAQMTVHS